MATDDHFFVSVDIGSSKIAILLAEEANGRLEVFGAGIGESAGVKKGVIVDVEKLSEAVGHVVEQAYLSCNTKIFNVSVNISDPQVVTVNREGQTTVSKKEVTEEDMASAIKIAKAMPTSANKQVINNIVNRWTLDKDPISHQGVVLKQPLKQKAITIEVSMYVATVSNQSIDAIEQSIRQNDLGLSNVVLTSIASSEAYINQNEKDQGVCLLDIGAGVTNLSVFTEGGITYSAVIEMGGEEITQSIAEAFNSSFMEAERLKIKYGNAQVKSLWEDKLIEFQQIDDGKGVYHYLSHQSLLEVIEKAYLTLFKCVQQDLKSQKFHHALKSGFVLTGGAAKISGCDALLMSYFKSRVKLGRVNSKVITAEQKILDPIYACALGLLLYEPDKADLREMQATHRNILGKIKRKFKQI